MTHEDPEIGSRQAPDPTLIKKERSRLEQASGHKGLPNAEGRRAEIDADADADADVKIVTPTLSRSLVRGKFLTLAVIFICAYLVARGVGL